MPLHRRELLRSASAAAGILLAAPSVALAQNSGVRTFNLYRGSKKIGTKSLTVARVGDSVDVGIEIDIDVRILGLPAYRYALSSNERWSGGVLRRLEARTLDNGDKDSVSATRTAAGLEVDGTGYSGVVGGNPATTTYWTQAFLSRPVWISTQTGKPLTVTVARSGAAAFPTERGQVEATRWAVRGEIGSLDLFYDNQGEWVGNEFEARGERARFVVSEKGGSLSSFWTG